MLSNLQYKKLDNFANLSDQLFDLGIITTDSFTGEIGEYIACRHFKLKKTNRVTKAIDGICESGYSYQIKSKVVSGNNFNYNLSNLKSDAFNYLVVVYLDINYCPIKLLRIPSKFIKNYEISITSTLLRGEIEIIDKKEIRIPNKEKDAIIEFAKAYLELEKSGIIRSRRIVGDIGEFYACHKLNLEMSNNRNEKGIDAKHKNGLTFEIKTRRVYKSGRRVSETRRLNNLVGKIADYLIVVTLDRSFKCSGMWLVPMHNLSNPKSANLKVVNTTQGTRNIVPSKIPGLKTGEKFISF
jgi:hypothetical protein